MLNPAGVEVRYFFTYLRKDTRTKVLKFIRQNCFYLLDQIVMMFSYENRKKIPHQLFFPEFQMYKNLKFHFRLGGNTA